MDATHRRDTAILIGINLTLKRQLETARQSPQVEPTNRLPGKAPLCGLEWETLSAVPPGENLQNRTARLC
ncbi:hypothetical protein [Nostoc sp.]|uniref:hypothetical protein n=1 Tax=Nostoc sp. TaxID=1180 RepID=UPI002FFD0596